MKKDMLEPGSLRCRARNAVLRSVKGAALGFPIGLLQVKIRETYRAAHSDQRQVKSSVNAAMESVVENFSK